MQSPLSGHPLQAHAGSTSSGSAGSYWVEISSRLFLWHTECSVPGHMPALLLSLAPFAFQELRAAEKLQ